MIERSWVLLAVIESAPKELLKKMSMFSEHPPLIGLIKF
jgi:hypothetical protein